MFTAVRVCSARSSLGVITAIAALAFSGGAVALNPNVTIKQLRHTAWGPNQGAPLGGAKALAQTSDGYLWMVGPAGLFRFDGISFERVELPRDSKLSSFFVHSIFAPHGGGLWIGFLFGGVAFLRDGHWHIYTAEDGLPPGSPIYFAESPDGALWVVTSADLARFDGTRWKAVGSELGLRLGPHPFLFIDGQGTIWAGSTGALYFLPVGEKRFRKIPVSTKSSWIFGTISESPEGTVWLATGTELVPLVQNPPPRTSNSSSASGPSRGSVFDHDETLWNAGVDGLRRIARPQHPTLGAGIRADHLVDGYTETDGLTAPVGPVLVDHEGNVWVGTNNGLDRFSEPRLEAPLESPNNVKALRGIGYAVGLAPSDDAGGLWVTNGQDIVLRYKKGQLSAPVLTHLVSCFLRASDGTVWMGGTGALLREQNGRLESFPAPGVRDTQALALDKSGHLWVSIIRAGEFQLKDGHWTPYGGVEALPRGPTAITIVRDRRDRLWFSYPGGTVAVLDGEQVRIYGAADGLAIGTVMANHPGQVHHWVGGELGLARFDGERFHSVASVPELPLDGITGIVETAGGDLWLNGRTGIVHLTAAELERSRLDPSYPVRGEAFGAFDGVVGSSARLRPLPTAIEAGDGMLWFSTSGGFYGIDPARPVHNSTPPPVHIRALTVGDRVLQPGSGVSLPERTTAVRFDYVGLSLTAAEKVRYRYRLDGVDSEWRPLTASRQALYTNLRPGKYTFRVIAANNDGVWNEQGDSLAFTIPPAFVQTGWFLALCVAAGALAVWALVRLRVRQVAARLRGRLEERLAERTRIARDLHDTLLQTIQGSKLVVDDALEQAGDSARSRRALEQVSGWLQSAIQEGRAALASLRASQEPDLAEALRCATEERAIQGGMEVRFSVVGAARELHPVVREEVYQICEEAIRNAWVHSRGRRLEVELRYAQDLAVRVRDDGAGMEPPMAEDGKKGHFGLQGMRERAARIGGKLTVLSSASSGTEITLVVAGSTAFRRTRKSVLQSLKAPLAGSHRSSDSA